MIDAVDFLGGEYRITYRQSKLGLFPQQHNGILKSNIGDRQKRNTGRAEAEDGLSFIVISAVERVQTEILKIEIMREQALFGENGRHILFRYVCFVAKREETPRERSKATGTRDT